MIFVIYVQQSEHKTQLWNEEMVALGYSPPLLTPILAIQTTTAAIGIP